MGYEYIEKELRKHPQIKDCVVARIPTGPARDMVVAYVVATTGKIDPVKVRDFLRAPKLAISQMPRAVIQVQTLPRTERGEVDPDSLPLPVTRGLPAGTKIAVSAGENGCVWGLLAIAAVVIGGIALALTHVIWPGSTDVSAVPQPYASLFTLLYVFECAAFGVGVGFLVIGYPFLRSQKRPRWLTVLAFLAMLWLLISWWPQDNIYRLTAKTDWQAQAWLVYVFNIPLMIAAAVVLAFAMWDRVED